MNKKIAIFFGGKCTKHLIAIKKAAKKEGVSVYLLPYNRIWFDTLENEVRVRGGLKVKSAEIPNLAEFDLFFFRTTGKHWEIVNLLCEVAEKNKIKVVDPLVTTGKSVLALKAWQMLQLSRNGIPVPKTVFGSLWYLHGIMKNSVLDNVGTRHGAFLQDDKFNFPVIIKGSSGDRGSNVFKVDNLDEMEKLVRSLRKIETQEGRRYMLQEFVPNSADFRVIVLGDKVLGIMKRARAKTGEEFRNNFSLGGSVEVASLPENIKDMCVGAAKLCGLAIAGVDVAFCDDDISKPVIWEVNKGPQFTGFMQATGIDVPREIVKFLKNYIPPTPYVGG